MRSTSRLQGRLSNPVPVQLPLRLTAPVLREALVSPVVATIIVTIANSKMLCAMLVASMGTLSRCVALQPGEDEAQERWEEGRLLETRRGALALQI